MSYLLSVDPGISTGITLWSVPENDPAQRLGAWQFGGGLRGFLQWRDDNTWMSNETGHRWFYFPEVNSISRFWNNVGLRVLSEKFTPLNNKGFSLTMESVEPLRIEGAMIALGMLPDYETKSPHWQRPSAMYWAGGKTLAERKKLARKWLKDHDLLVPAKELGAPDNNDVVSADLHALAWLRRHHRPTLAHYWKDEE